SLPETRLSRKVEAPVRSLGVIGTSLRARAEGLIVTTLQGCSLAHFPGPILGGSMPNPIAQKIIDICDEVFDDNSDDCNKFAKAVAAKFSITLTGNADSIVDAIQGEGWTVLADGVEAKSKADDGWFVVGGLKGADQTPPVDHGHVVIVVSGPLAH